MKVKLYIHDELVKEYDNIHSVRRFCDWYILHKFGGNSANDIYIAIDDDVSLQVSDYPLDYPF